MPRKPFLLRIDDQLLTAIQRWAAADMRSLNGQIEFLLRDALRRTGRLPTRAAADEAAVRVSEPELE
ncbi:MAG: hypothetical protein Q8K55_15590 [Gemmatimonadaceae bacterium]|nr:hypothetical protein [Gemmatimonadaceae bacterium]